MNYKVEKEMQNRKLGRKKIPKNGFVMKLKLKSRKDFIEVKEITIMNDILKDNVLKKQFDKAFKRMLKMVMSVRNDEDASDGDIKIAMTEVERMKAILKDKYRDELRVKDFYAMWRKADFLETELKEKIVERQRVQEMIWRNMMTMNNLYEKNLEEEKGRGR